MSKYFHNEVDIQCIKNRCGFIWNFFSLHDHSMYYVWGNLKDDRNECRQKAKRQAQPEDERWRYRMKLRNGGLGDVVIEKCASRWHLGLKGPVHRLTYESDVHQLSNT